jgi:predicted amidohydrolase
MILAAAQTKPKQGNIKENLLDHYRLAEIASANGCNLIAFPELSITGYERENAHNLAFTRNDPRLAELREIARRNNITIIAGAPIKINTNLYIGSFIFSPDNTVSVYTKQFLHLGEEKYYKPSVNYNPVIKLGMERISLAICADIDHSSHPKNAYETKSTIYVSSLFFTPNGIPEAYQLLSNYAKTYGMDVLMTNYSGESWDLISGGKSAFWSKNGERIAEMNDSCSGLLIVKKNNSSWIGQCIDDNA